VLVQRHRSAPPGRSTPGLGGQRPGFAHKLAEAERLGSDLTVEGLVIELGQRCTLAPQAYYGAIKWGDVVSVFAQLRQLRVSVMLCVSRH
jgi:hypothetical protein